MVVSRLPTSTMNITGFLIWIRGSSFQIESIDRLADDAPDPRSKVLRARSDMVVS